MPHCSPSRERREAALAEIGQCVLQDRNASYGDPEDNFQDIADRWSVLFRGRGVTFTPADVAAMMCDVKLARLRTSMGKADNWVDLAGYAVCGYSVTQQPVAVVEPTQRPVEAVEPKTDDPTSFVFKVGDRVRHDEHGEGTVAGNVGFGLSVTYDNGRQSNHPKNYLTFLSRPGEEA